MWWFNRLLQSGMLLALLSFGCTREEPATMIDTSRTETVKPRESKQGETIRIALGGMITPKEGMVYYRELLDYIGTQVGRQVQYLDEEDYAEINRKLQTGELEAAFVCSGPYVDGKSKFGLEFIAAPQAYGEAVYYSYFIVPAKSPAKDLEDLRGKSFAFTDPLSNSGKLVPEYVLARKGETPGHFFNKLSFSGSHDNSIKAVAEGLVDAAAVDSLIWEYKNRKFPEQTANTRILYKSEPFAPPPFVVRPGVDPALKKRLREILLHVHQTPQGRAILDKMMIDRFVTLDDTAYDTVRDIKRWISQSKKR